MIDICFMYLPHPFLKRPNAQLPIGILMLAAVIKKDGEYSVDVKNYSSFTIENAIENLPEARIYGLTATSMETPIANEFAKRIKENYPLSKIILGGPGSVVTEHSDSGYIDCVVKGEADIAIFFIIEKLLKDIFLENTIDCIVPFDLDSLPFPARNIMHNDKIGGGIFAYEGDTKESTQILTSRGCPFCCSFCASNSVCDVVRYRNPDNVIKEINHVIEAYGIRRFRFADDLFTFPRERAIELSEKIGLLDIEWRVSARVTPIDKEMLSIMKDAGCRELSFGCESFDDEVLKILNKKATCKDNIRALKLADEVGIDARILLMIGTPGQTYNAIKKNMEYINHLPHKIVACTTFMPMPGSDVWYNPDKYNIEILSRDMRDYNFYFFGSDGINELKPIIKLKDRPLDEFMQESEEFRQWLSEREDVNRG